MPGKKQHLLLDEEEQEENLTLQVNESYAKRFEHNKQREELHRLQAKHPELAKRLEAKALKARGEGIEEVGADGDEDESTEEEEDDGEIPDETEAQILETLLRIRNKDPAIYDSSVKFFQDEDEDEDGGAAGDNGSGAADGAKKSKPVYLKDVLAKQALEQGPEVSSSDDDEDALGKGQTEADARPVKAYDEEQEQIRKAFLSAVQGDDADADEDGFGGVLKPRAPQPGDNDDDGGDDEQQPAAGAQRGKKRVEKLAAKCFSGKDESEEFLRNFILNKEWIDKEERGYIPTYGEILGDGDEVVADDEEDEAYVEEADKFEAAYNFRFEEPGGSAIVTHPRVVDGSLRRPDDRRKKSRDAKKERQKTALSAHEEEVKRLKNLKKKEIEERLSKIAEVAGASLAVEDEDEDNIITAGSQRKRAKGKDAASKAMLRLDPSLLEGDFDPEEWDKQMAAAFDEDYYAGEDETLDDILGDDADMDQLMGPLSGESDREDGEGNDEDGAVGFKSVRKKLVGKKGDASEEGVAGLDDDGSADPAAAEASAAARAELNQLLEEYYKLDYEGVAGGIKTRFKYREVPKTTFGLTMDDILAHTDKELNQVVGLKRLAPYREDDGDRRHQRPNYKALEMLKQSGPADDSGQKGKRQWHHAQHKPHKTWQPRHDQDGQHQSYQAAQQHAPADATAAANGSHERGQHNKHKQQNEQEQHQKQKGSHEQPGAAHKQHAGKQSGQGGKGKEKPVLDPIAARKASYAPLSLPGGKSAPAGKKRKQDGMEKAGQEGDVPAHKKQKQGRDGQQAEQAKQQPQPLLGPNGEALKKSQKKNLKRALKRQAAKQAQAGAQ